MRRDAMPLPPVQSDSFIPMGGLDEVTPPLQLADGACWRMSNFEQGIRGGYRRIEGFERWAGNIPTDALQFQQMRLSASVGPAVALWAGEMIEGVTSGARAVIAGPEVAAGISPTSLSSVLFLATPTVCHVLNVRGQFVTGEALRTIQPAGTTPVDLVVGTPPFDLPATTAAAYAAATQSAEDAYREAILPATGTATFASTQIVGLGAIGRTVYAFIVTWNASLGVRNLEAWKASVSEPNDPQLTVNWQWEQEAIVAIDGSSAIFPTAPTRMDLVEYNFSGAVSAKKLYGVTGIGKAFSFDGTTFVAITTGMSTDTPTRIAVHKNRLFLGFGASLQFSTAADPTSWSPVTGAGEISMGEPITALATVVGSDASSALLVGTDKGVAVLYGDSSSNFNLVWISRDIGMRAGSLQVMSTPLFVNDYGVTSLAASQSFGNFETATISQSVQKFIKPRLQRVTCSVLVRSKNQYRVFFDDGSGLYFTFKGSRLAAITPIQFDLVVRRTWVTLDYAGRELIVFATDDGYVYRMDVGRNFDGRSIDAYLFMALNHMKAPRLRKTFKRASLEVDCDAGYVAFQAGANIDHGGPDAMQSPETALENQQGALWDEFRWDDFVWDTGARQPTVLPLDGTGKNIGLWLRCNDRLVAPFALTGVMTEYLARRLER